jgi:hypothetical protein
MTMNTNAMKNDRRLFFRCAGLLALVLGQGTPASAQIVLTQPRFEAGQKFAAFFKVEHGCGGSPTVSLRVEIPEGVAVLDTPPKPGWTVHPEGEKGNISAVTWRGRLDPKASDQFGLFVKLPPNAGAVYFPALQHCEKGELRWDGIPRAGQSPRDIAHPAPMLQLTAATTPASYMAGNITIGQVWSAATPGGASTGAAYMTIMNHGTVADTLLGGTTPVASGFEIHQMSMANGIMTMRPMPGGIAIPAGSTVTLGPQANYHVMLTGLKQPLKEGTHVPATLNFAKAGMVQVELAVGPIGARAPAAASGAMGAMPGMDHH